MKHGNAVIAQGGGPTSVINQSLVGAVIESRRFLQVERFYGALNGVNGIINENFVDLTQCSLENLGEVAQTPSSALLSTRDKPDAAYCEKIFAVLKSHDVKWFFYCGGNDSADTCRILSESAQAAQYDLRVIHIPKTIDNDLRETDHCPGFGSAGKFVAQAFAGANLDNRALGGIYIGIVMGRDAGFLTAASVLDKRYNDDGPHLVYVPEVPFTEEKFLADVKRVYDRLGRCVIAVSEGIRNADGEAMISVLTGSTERDAHGNAQLSGTGALGDRLSDLVKAKLGVKRVRADTFGYIQRSFAGCVSEVDAAEARSVGEKAVQFGVLGESDGSVAIKRIGDYAVEYRLVPLSSVARLARSMPQNYYDMNVSLPTKDFVDYARPLVGKLATVAQLDAPIVGKKLKV